MGKHAVSTTGTQPLSPTAWALILLAGGAGVGEVLWTSQQGVPVSPDGLVYLSSAQAFAEGFGFRVQPQPDGPFLQHYPPLYPFLLGLMLLLGADLNAAPILLNAVFFFLFPVSLGWILYRLTRTPVLAIAGAWLGWLAPGFYPAFAFPWTEPLYLLTSLWGLYCLARYLAEFHLRHLIAAGSLLGLAWLSRYIGASLWITSVLALLFFPRCSRKTRLLSCGIFMFLAGAPMGFWLIRNWLLTGSTTDRVMAFHPPGRGSLYEITLTLQPWLAAQHGGFPSYRALWFSLLIVFSILLLWAGKSNGANRTISESGSNNLKTVFLISIGVFLSGFTISVLTDYADPVTALTRWVAGPGTPLLGQESMPVLISLLFFIPLLITGNLNASAPSQNRSPSPAWFFVQIGVLYCGIYFTLLLITMTWFDPFTRFLPRLLSPLLMVAVIICFLSLKTIFFSTQTMGNRRTPWQLTLPVAGLILMFSYTHQKTDWLTHARQTGIGDMSRDWRSAFSRTQHALTGNNAEIYSNHPVLYSLLTGDTIRFGTLNNVSQTAHSNPVLYVHLNLYKNISEDASPPGWQTVFRDDHVVWYALQHLNNTPHLR